MARPHDARVEEALRGTGAAVARDRQGTWSISLVGGASVPARARMSGGWLELRAAMPDGMLSRQDDLEWLRLNASLRGSARVARTARNGMPQVILDEHVDRDPDLAGRVTSACAELTGVVHAIDAWPEDPPPLPFESETTRTSAADVERVCTEAGWSCRVGGEGSLHLDIDTRAGLYAARLEPLSTGEERVVVDLMDLNGESSASRRAVAALLMAVSGSVRSIKGVMSDRGGVTVAALASPVGAPLDQSLDRALSALAVACTVCGREVRTLQDEHLAADYLALWNTARQHDSQVTMTEERTCLQQL